MTEHKHGVSVEISDSPDRDGLMISVTNVSGHLLRIRFPNPYSGVRLYSEVSKLVPQYQSYLCWREDDPERTVQADETVVALIKLHPTWCNLDGTYLARCPIVITGSEGQSSTVVFEGEVRVALGARPARPSYRDSTAPPPKPRLMNVSDFTTIIREPFKENR